MGEGRSFIDLRLRSVSGEPMEWRAADARQEEDIGSTVQCFAYRDRTNEARVNGMSKALETALTAG